MAKVPEYQPMADVPRVPDIKPTGAVVEVEGAGEVGRAISKTGEAVGASWKKFGEEMQKSKDTIAMHQAMGDAHKLLYDLDNEARTTQDVDTFSKTAEERSLEYKKKLGERFSGDQRALFEAYYDKASALRLHGVHSTVSQRQIQARQGEWMMTMQDKQIRYNMERDPGVKTALRTEIMDLFEAGKRFLPPTVLADGMIKFDRTGKEQAMLMRINETQDPVAELERVKNDPEIPPDLKNETISRLTTAVNRYQHDNFSKELQKVVLRQAPSDPAIEAMMIGKKISPEQAKYLKAEKNRTSEPDVDDVSFIDLMNEAYQVKDQESFNSVFRRLRDGIDRGLYKRGSATNLLSVARHSFENPDRELARKMAHPEIKALEAEMKNFANYHFQFRMVGMPARVELEDSLMRFHNRIIEELKPPNSNPSEVAARLRNGAWQLLSSQLARDWNVKLPEKKEIPNTGAPVKIPPVRSSSEGAYGTVE